MSASSSLKWRESHREEARAAAKAWREKNPERARASEKAWREKNSGKVRAYQDNWVKQNPEKRRVYARRSQLKQKYGLTQEVFDKMVLDQGGVCPICRTSPPEHVDHDHSTGKVRKILCGPCNLGLGCFKDNLEVVLRAALYLEEHK